MHQHQIRILNQPEPSSEELFVQMARQAHALARKWSETAIATGLESLLLRNDETALQGIVGQARQRRLLSPEGREAVVWLAETCTRRISGLTNPDAPATRSKALMLSDNTEELYALAAVIDEALDLQAALQARHRIGAQD